MNRIEIGLSNNQRKSSNPIYFIRERNIIEFPIGGSIFAYVTADVERVDSKL